MMLFDYTVAIFSEAYHLAFRYETYCLAFIQQFIILHLSNHRLIISVPSLKTQAATLAHEGQIRRKSLRHYTLYPSGKGKRFGMAT